VYKLVYADPATWPTPTAKRVVEAGQYGAVRVRVWAGRHPKLQDRTRHGTKEPSPIVPLTLVLIEVSRRPGDPIRRRCSGCGGYGPPGAMPDLDMLWRAYVRRFDLEHICRFIKQTLGWHTLRVRHPEQAYRWTWLAVEHGGDTIFQNYSDRLARVFPADGTLVPTDLDIAAHVEAADANLPPRAGGEVDAAVAQEREVQLACGTGTGG